MIDWSPVPTWEPPTGDALAAIAVRAARLRDERVAACRPYYPADDLDTLGAHDVVSCALTNVVNPVARSARYSALVSLISDLFRSPSVDLSLLADAQRRIAPESAFLAGLAEDIGKIVRVCDLASRDLGDGQRVVDALRRYAELLTENKIIT
jgi:hypothetical protein